MLENISNPKLKRVLHERLRTDKFNFFGGSYTETNKARSKHKDTHEDNYEESHRDKHRDWFNPASHSAGPGWIDYEQGTHTDKGYSESYDRGYSEHPDHY